MGARPIGGVGAWLAMAGGEADMAGAGSGTPDRAGPAPGGGGGGCKGGATMQPASSAAARPAAIQERGRATVARAGRETVRFMSAMLTQRRMRGTALT